MTLWAKVFSQTRSIFLSEFYHFCEFQVQPVGVFPLDKNHSANDVSPNKSAGKSVGVLWAPGIHGEPDGSLLLQGSADSYIELDQGNLDTKKSLTILAFIYPMGSEGPIVNYKVDGNGVQLWETKSRGEGTLMARFNRRDVFCEFLTIYGDEFHLGRKHRFHQSFVCVCVCVCAQQL